MFIERQMRFLAGWQIKLCRVTNVPLPGGLEGFHLNFRPHLAGRQIGHKRGQGMCVFIERQICFFLRGDKLSFAGWQVCLCRAGLNYIGDTLGISAALARNEEYSNIF